MGIRAVLSAPRSPWQPAYVERGAALQILLVSFEICVRTVLPCRAGIDESRHQTQAGPRTASVLRSAWGNDDGHEQHGIFGRDRHSNIGITQNIYIKSVTKSQVSAMDSLIEYLGACNAGKPAGELKCVTSTNLRRCWSRGRELNSRPADYEMDCSSPSRFFSVGDVWRCSCSLGLGRQDIVQRDMQRLTPAPLVRDKVHREREILDSRGCQKARSQS
jgi:hypothetical protein